ncbi:hypothetical protein Plhal304r1_c071g0159751 [Plasmopara halstedii]
MARDHGNQPATYLSCDRNSTSDPGRSTAPHMQSSQGFLEGSESLLCVTCYPYRMTHGHRVRDRYLLKCRSMLTIACRV